MQNKTINTVADIDYLIDEISYEFEDINIAIDDYKQSEKTESDKETLKAIAYEVTDKIFKIKDTYTVADNMKYKAYDKVESEVLHNIFYRIERLFEAE